MPLSQNAPVLDPDHPVGHLRQLQIVRDHDERLVPGFHGKLQKAEHVLSVSGIQISRGLVGEDQRRPHDERPSDGRPLLPAAGKLLRKSVQPFRKAEGLRDWKRWFPFQPLKPR